MPRAASLAAELKNKFDVEATLVEGGGGIFDITVDGQLVFSKHGVDRFPEDGEVIELIDDQLDG